MRPAGASLVTTLEAGTHAMARTYAKVFEALRSAAVKTLLTGVAPGAAEWSVVFSALIGDLVEGPDAMLGQLTRVEEKVDELRTLQFTQPLGKAQLQLRDAMAEHRSKKQRRALLADARNSLREALPAAPDALAMARVHWSLAMVWLADQELTDCFAELEWAGNINLRILQWDLGWIREPPADDVEEIAGIGMSRLERLAKEIGLGNDAAKARARRGMSRLYLEEMVAAQADLERVQKARRELGVPAGATLVPTVLMQPGARHYAPAITIAGVPGQNSFAGLNVTVDRAIAVLSRDRPANMLDVEVTLTAGQGTPGLVVGFQPLHAFALDPVNIVGRGGGLSGNLVRSRAMLGSRYGQELGLAIPGRSLLAGQAGDRIVVQAGQTRHGWIRTDCKRTARGTTHQAAHAGNAGFVGLRVAFGPRAGGAIAGPWTIDLMLPVTVEPSRFALSARQPLRAIPRPLGRQGRDAGLMRRTRPPRRRVD